MELKAEKQSTEFRVQSYNEQNRAVCSVAFSPDGLTIVSGSADETIKVWDAGSLARHIPHPAQS
jgi:WD40 repeat protein